MPDADIEVAVAVAERVRGLVADQGFAVSGAADKLPVTISIGVATTRDPTETTGALIGRADEALYQAKGRGRNCVAAVEVDLRGNRNASGRRSEEHTSELQSLMRISYATFCLKKKK